MSLFSHYSGHYQSSKKPRKKAGFPVVFLLVLLIAGLGVWLYRLLPQVISAFAPQPVPAATESTPDTQPTETAVPTTVPATVPAETTQPTTEATEPAPTLPPMTAAEQTIYEFAQENGIALEAYPEKLVAMLEHNPDTEDFVLHYPLEHEQTFEVDLQEYAGSETVPLFMQWDRRWGYMDYGGELAAISACGPVCLSMVVCHLTEDFSHSPDVMIRLALDCGYRVPGQGTYWSFLNFGGAHFGLSVSEFTANRERILANLEVGNPIICIMGPGDFTEGGHFIVLSGLEDGLIRVNDPNSYANSEKLWEYDDIHDQIKNVWVFRK